MVASPKPMVPVFAFTTSLHMEQLIIMLKKRRLLKKGDRVVITTGIPVGIPNQTNIIRVEEVP